MRRVPLSDVEPGDELGGTIKVPSSQAGVLYKLRMKQGTELTEKKIDRLARLNIGKVPIKDRDTEDLNGYVHDEAVEEAEEKVREDFDRFSSELEEGSVDREDVNRLRSTVNDLIDALRNSELMAAFTSLKTHDSYTAEHSLDVAKIVLQLAMKNEQELRKELKANSGASDKYINRHMLEDLGLGALLHDLGKEEVPRRVINKPEQLTDDEWELMEDHPKEGFEKLRAIDHCINAPVKVPALQHHEKYDGSGYPRGLSDRDIHLFGRLCAPADVYSALTSDRPYREGQSPSSALTIMEDMQNEGPHFDPDVFESFQQLVFPYPIGEEIELSDGRRGVVADVDPDNPRQPTVRVLYEQDERVDSPEEIQVTNRPGELRVTDPPRRELGVARG